MKYKLIRNKAIKAVSMQIFLELSKLVVDKSYDDSVKLKRTEMDPFRLG